MLNGLLAFSKRVDKLNKWVGVFVRWLTVLLVLVTSYNALARYLGKFIGINLSSNSFLEIQWYLFSIVFLLGAGYALLHNVHIRVDVLYDRLSEKQKARLNFLGTIIFLLPFSFFVVVVSLPWVINSWAIWEMSPDPGGLPRFPIKTLVPLAFIFLFLQGVSEAIKNFAVLQGRSTIHPAAEHEEANKRGVHES